jgi:hypothetical protein
LRGNFSFGPILYVTFTSNIYLLQYDEFHLPGLDRLKLFYTHNGINRKSYGFSAAVEACHNRRCKPRLTSHCDQTSHGGKQSPDIICFTAARAESVYPSQLIQIESDSGCKNANHFGEGKRRQPDWKCGLTTRQATRSLQRL